MIIPGGKMTITPRFDGHIQRLYDDIVDLVGYNNKLECIHEKLEEPASLIGRITDENIPLAERLREWRQLGDNAVANITTVYNRGAEADHEFMVSPVHAGFVSLSGEI